ncbi:MAG: DUF3050 domain-containing protein [Deltaproteobacteria bacterium]|nr:DUF3050 domain-containing protein [Deltaproteobacteria bacterium]
MRNAKYFSENPHLDALITNLEGLRSEILRHPIYQKIRDERCLRNFMENHCFVVWDFMSLLKFLQRSLSSVEIPWRPRGDARSRRLINEIVMEEESDEDGKGSYLSHFELYRQAMVEAGADTHKLDAFLHALEDGHRIKGALTRAGVSEGPSDFLLTTWSLLETESVPAIASAFTLGREDLVPAMFHHLVAGLGQSHPERWGTFLFYLNRHIQLDGDTHGPMALQLLARICGDDAARWRQAHEAAEKALRARLRLWDFISGTL